MYNVVFSSILLVIGLVNGHTLISRVNGGTTGLRTVYSNSPIKDVNSPEMVCGLGSQPSTGPLNIQAGGTLKLDYVHSANQAIDKSHQGPCIAYIAEASNPTKFSKFFEDGYDASGKSCITRRLGTTRSLTLNLPNDLKPGNYIVRSELIALHQADGPPPNRGAEFYIQCIDITVTGGIGAASVGSSGVGVGPNAVTIPGYLTQESPGVRFNVYSGKSNSNYPVPGPPIDQVYTFSAPNNAPESGSPPPTGNVSPPPQLSTQPKQPIVPASPSKEAEVLQPVTNPATTPNTSPPSAENQELAPNDNPASTLPDANSSTSEIESLFLASGFVLKSSAESQFLHHAFATNFVLVISLILLYQ